MRQFSYRLAFQSSRDGRARAPPARGQGRGRRPARLVLAHARGGRRAPDGAARARAAAENEPQAPPQAFSDSEIETDSETETDGGTDPPFTAADRDRVFEANPGEFFHVLDVGPAQIVVSWIYRLDQISVEAGAAAFWDEHPDVQRVPQAECYFSSDDTQNVANGRAGYTDVTDKVVYIKHGGFRTYARGALHIVGHYEPHEERVFPLTNAARAGCLDKLYRDLLRLGGPALADDITAAGAVVFGARAPSQETCGLCGKPRAASPRAPSSRPPPPPAPRTLVLGRVCERKLKAAVRIARFVRNGVGSVDAVRAEGMAANAAV